MRMGILTPTKWLLDLTVGLEIWEYSTRTGKLNQSCIPWSSLQPFPGGLTYISYGDSRRKIKIKPLKAGFHERRSRSRSRSRNQKRRTYDLVKTAFRFRLRLRRLRSAYDLGGKPDCRSRKQEQKNQTNHKAWERALWLVYPSASASDSDNLVSLDHKRNVSEGVVSGVGRNGNALILLTPIPSLLRLHFYVSDSDSVK